ncbi:MAG: LacI family transcriptional regulator [Rhodobacteraceae bacterium]|nr:LacI family transcriptional regulator [Paracoccaceae bacterium]
MKLTGRTTLKTLAKASGVSVATASQVIRGVGRISEHTRKRVLSTAEKMNYIPDGRAISMRSGERPEIGMIIQELANPFNAEVVSGVSDSLERHGYFVSVLDSRNDIERQKRNIKAFIRSARGGLIWVPAHNTPSKTIDLLRNHSIPTITFLRQIKGADFDHIGIKNTEGTEMATEYLIKLGHTKIAYFGGNLNSDVRKDRAEGYELSLKKHGLDWKVIWTSEDTKQSGVERLHDLISEHPDVTALVCNGDMVALGACLALQSKNLQPGKDISVIGFDNVMDTKLVTPSLTTMEVKPYNLGLILAETILRRINEKDHPQITYFNNPELIVRNSTGPA